MSLQIDSTKLFCAFCAQNGRQVPLVRSMHGLYCTNEHCYSRNVMGNLAPASACENCGENAFYAEPENQEPHYRCIACAHETLV